MCPVGRTHVRARCLCGAAKGGTSFLNYSLGETTGTNCPGQAACSNIAAEPAIRADGAGRFFGSSENSLGEGTVAFRSTDNGLHYTTLVSPDSVSQANDTGFAPGGGDTDLAVAPDKNAAGFYKADISQWLYFGLTGAAGTATLR